MTNYTEEKNTDTIKKYRLGYDYVFVANSFTFKGELLSGVSVNVLFKVFDERGIEKLFGSNELDVQELHLKNAHTCCLTDLLSCSFDRNNILNFKLNSSLLENSGYTIQWEIDSYTKDLGVGFVEPKCVPKEEFIEIMKNHIDLFDCSDNYPTQSCSYFTQEVKE